MAQNTNSRLAYQNIWAIPAAEMPYFDYSAAIIQNQNSFPQTSVQNGNAANNDLVDATTNVKSQASDNSCIFNTFGLLPIDALDADASQFPYDITSQNSGADFSEIPIDPALLQLPQSLAAYQHVAQEPAAPVQSLAASQQQPNEQQPPGPSACQRHPFATPPPHLPAPPPNAAPTQTLSSSIAPAAASLPTSTASGTLAPVPDSSVLHAYLADQLDKLHLDSCDAIAAKMRQIWGMPVEHARGWVHFARRVGGSGVRGRCARCGEGRGGR
ncbi:hypothetical protein B0A49_02261 [Cryomyces minteri]|uniref:Uncharacterized protein n=1 Tax=Cryomyces minteri TaxID=331657 RepID=A0A4U0XGZ6_9PEZI|nr:hypothetical protein B0A49_02261 [Cryomyces minteri]